MNHERIEAAYSFSRRYREQYSEDPQDLESEDPTIMLYSGYLKLDSTRSDVFGEGALPLLEGLFEKGKLRRGMLALDLGCNTGLMVGVLAEVYGLETYGMDMRLYPTLKAMDVYRQLGVKNAGVVWGNAFHPAFVGVDEVTRWGRARGGKGRTKTGLMKGRVPEELRPYAELVYGRLPSLDEYDLHYIYQYVDNTVPLVNMVAQMGRVGAYVICGGPGHLEASLEHTGMSLPENMVEVDRNENAVLLQKR